MVGAQCHTATVDLSLPWGAWARGILGFGQLRIPTLCIYTVRSLASGSPSFYPTQPSPAAIEDLLTPVQVVPGLGPLLRPLPARLPGIPTPHLPRASGKLPAPRVSLGESPSLHPSRLPCEPVCPTSSSADLPSTGRRNTEALFTSTGPCLGAWPRAQVGGPGTKLREGGAGCPVPPSQPPWAGLDATLPSPRWDGSQWPADHHHHHHDATARFYGLRTLPRPVWALLWETGFLPSTSNISKVI